MKTGVEYMNSFPQLPKSMKKAIRYLYQDAPVEKLEDIQKILNQVIESRLEKESVKES